MAKANPYRLIFIDADDTLFNFQVCESNAIINTYHNFGIKPAGDVVERYRTINHQLWKELEKGSLRQDDIKHERFKRLVDYYGWKIDYMKMSLDYIANISEERVLVGGAEEVCRYLFNKYKLILLTNGISEIQRSRFEGSVLSRFFSKIVISDEACCSKPDPGIFEWALEDTGFKDREEMMIVGDSLSSDIQGGINFGISTCWYNPDGKDPGEIMPDFTISNLAELKILL
jgi:2-haloacid dehalogenase